MDTVTLLTQAKGLGLALSVTDGRLNVTGPKTAEAAVLVANMAAHKAELIALLAQPAQRPPLPQALWITGIVAFTEARNVQRALAKTYLTACGLAEDGFWYVACPGSGLTAKAAINE